MAELEELKEMGYVKEHEKTKKGGSYMCHKSYCYRVRTSTRAPPRQHQRGSPRPLLRLLPPEGGGQGACTVERDAGAECLI